MHSMCGSKLFTKKPTVFKIFVRDSICISDLYIGRYILVYKVHHCSTLFHMQFDSALRGMLSIHMSTTNVLKL